MMPVQRSRQYQCGSQPSAWRFNPADHKIYVANSGTNFVTVIDGESNTASKVTVGRWPLRWPSIRQPTRFTSPTETTIP